MVKKYIIMAGGDYEHWETPRHLSVINGEEIMARTIRLLKENGVEDISISTDNPIFEKFGLPILRHDNNYKMIWHDMEGDWLDCFYPTNEPVCYILGDVYFSEEAIKTIVETETDDIELFGSIPPFEKRYIKNHIEAFALKVENLNHFKEALKKTRELDKQGKFYKKPIIWELWYVIKDLPLQKEGEEYIYNYTKINDYTCDVDWGEDIDELNVKMKKPTKKLSIITPYYKTLDLMKELMNRLIPQLTKDVEYIIVDDGCNEIELDTYLRDVLGGCKYVKIIHLKENKGGAYANNTGIKEAKGKYIGFVDSDDMVAENYIETLLNTLKTQSEDVIYMAWQDIYDGAIVRNPRNYAVWKAIYNRDTIPMFNGNVRYSFDVPFDKKLNQKEFTKYDIDEVLYFYNSHRSGNLTEQKRKLRRKEMVKVEAIKEFTLEKFDKLENIKRNKQFQYEDKKIYIGDTFECDEEMAKYLTGGNSKNKIVVKVLEVVPDEPINEPIVDKKVEEVQESVKEEVKKPKSTKKKKTNKK